MLGTFVHSGALIHYLSAHNIYVFSPAYMMCDHYHSNRSLQHLSNACLANHTNKLTRITPVYDGERQLYGTSTQTHYISNRTTAGLMLPELAQDRSKCNQINARPCVL